MALHLLLAFVMLNLSQLLLINSWETGLYFTGISIYVISLCFFFASSIKNLDDWREARNYYLAAVVVTSLILIVLGIFGLLGGAGGLMELYVGSRVMGFFKDPNVAGPFVVTGALFAVSQLIFNQRRSISALAFMFVITIFSVILTFSRGAIVNLLSGMLVIYIIALFAHRGLRFTIFGLISVLPVLYLFNYFVMSFEQASRFMSIPAYDLSRIAVWKEGIRLFMEHPWGIGPGQFESYSQIYEKSIVGQTQRMAAHSLYVRVLAENGALGFTVLVLAYASIYHLCIKAIRISAHSGMDELSNAAWLASSFTGIVIESIFVDTLHWRHVWIIAGLIIAFHNIMGAKAMRRRYD